MRVSHAGWLALSILTIQVVAAEPVLADECVTHYSETFNFCGLFHDNCDGETWTEDSVGCLKHFLRFESLPLYGAHKLRMGVLLQDLAMGSPTPETVDFTAKQQSGCDGTGAYSGVVTCGEDDCWQLTDYNLGFSGTTDICIGIESNNLNPIGCGGECGRDEVLPEHGVGGCHYHPVIVTTLPDDTETLADADCLTNPGSILSGSYLSTQTSDNVRETLKEASVPVGKSKLLHVWRFSNVPAGSSHELLIEGKRANNPDNDNFQFGFNAQSCGPLFQTIPFAVINSATETSANYAFGSGSLNGTIYIAVWDTVAAGSHRATVDIDKIAIRTIYDCP